MAFTFREEDKPKFRLHYAALIALLLLSLLFLLAKESDVFHLNAKEIAQIQAEQEQMEREMTFRFTDSPEDMKENPDAPFLSDAARHKRSLQEENAPAENEDPLSRGETLELTNAPVAPPQDSPPAPPSPAVQQPQQNPAEASEPVAEAQPELPEEPQEPTETDTPAEEAAQNPLAEKTPQPAEASEETGDIPIYDDGPKPYRRLSKAEIASARKDAVKEIKLRESAPAVRSGATGRYNNPDGSSAPRTGLSVETNRDDMGPYLKILRQLIKGNWRIPNLAKFEISGVTAVSFKIQKDGTITDVEIFVGSGHEPLDTASKNAVVNTYKAPPLPAHVDEEWVPIKFGFYYNMRPTYNR